MNNQTKGGNKDKSENILDFCSDKLFDNKIEENKIVDEKKRKTILSSVIDKIFNRTERVLVILLHEYLNEEEAANYLRLPDPSGTGKETIRNYALRSKVLSYAKVGRNGLIFSKTDLDNFFRSKKVITHRDV